ncbi:MAG: PAS domain S-box protein [Anaerolineales bacterium]|jgi:PAS domain S-box-containing protein
MIDNPLRKNTGLGPKDTLLEKILDSMEFAIIILDEGQQILFFNQGAEHILGYQAQEVLGQPHDVLFPDRFVETHRQNIKEFAQDPGPATKMAAPGDILARRKGGAEFPVEASVTKMSQNGDLFLTVVLRDISARRQAEAKIREEREQLEALFDGMPIPTYVWQRREQDFVLIAFNCAAHDYTHGFADQLLGNTLTELYGDRPEVIEDFYRCFGEKVTVHREFAQASMVTGQWRDFNIRYVPVAPDLVLVHTEDITERKQAEHVLLRQAQIIDQIHDAVVSTDLDGYVTSWNKGAEGMFGYTAEDAIGKHISFVYPEEQLDFLQQEVIAPLKAKGNHQLEVLMRKKDGQDFDAHLSLSLLRDASGEPIGMIGYAMDITERKRAEQALRESEMRLRELGQQVVTVQEQERRRVSRELHDEASQLLTALKISLDLLGKDLPEEPKSLHERIEDAAGLADETMERVRLLAHDLRPPELEAVGIDPVLEDYCQEFGRRTPLAVRYQGTDLPALPDEVSICLYRVLQEALTNVLKHAQARKVRVGLGYDGDVITLSVSDDGQGLDADDARGLSHAKGIGILGMRERLELLGGDLEIRSRPGEGVHLKAWVPRVE